MWKMSKNARREKDKLYKTILSFCILFHVPKCHSRYLLLTWIGVKKPIAGLSPTLFQFYQVSRGRLYQSANCLGQKPCTGIGTPPKWCSTCPLWCKVLASKVNTVVEFSNFGYRNSIRKGCVELWIWRSYASLLLNI